MTEFLESIGFKHSEADPCVYVRNNSSLIIIAVYVDDLIVMSENQEQLKDIKHCLKARFEMKDMDELHYCLGISVERSDCGREIHIHQKKYLKDLLSKFGMEDSKPVSTPMDINVKLEKNDGVSKNVDPILYQSMVGSLLYAAVATRPDIAQAVAAVSKFNSCPNESHLTAVKRIFRYLKGTLEFVLKYMQSDFGLELLGFSDADWAGDLDNRRSTTGNLFMLANGVITWLSKRQVTVSLSTAEAEYVALCSATQEAIWLRRLLGELGWDQEKPTKIYEDNQGTIAMSKNPVNHSRTKHIDIKYHLVCDAVQNNLIELEYCQTEKMLADIMTKPLARGQFEMLRAKMGILKS